MRNDGQRLADQLCKTADFKDIKAIWPLMSDVDVISYFMSFECILELNEVDKSLWARLDQFQQLK